MLVCICKGLSERHIQGVVSGGAHTVDEVGSACGAGTDCGTCQGAIEELISEHRLTESGRQLRALRAPCASSVGEATHEGQRPGY
jgi:bacterioferritin-associated ferredoxin